MQEKWGVDKVIQISNYSYLKSKAVLKDCAKYLEIDFDIINKITSLIPAKSADEDGNPIEVDMDEVLTLPQMQSYIEKYPEMFKLAKKLEGSIRGANIHAGGLVILPQPIDEIIPVTKKKGDDGSDVYVSQWNKKQIESIGLIKFDFLGLSTLDVLSDCEELTGMNPNDIPLDDENTWEFLKQGKNMLGVFQLAENKTKKLLRDVQPYRLQDLSDINALIRPGMDIESYLSNKKAKKITYQFNIPEWQEELKDTCGIVLYQENVIRLANKLGGLTLGQGDMLRRAMEKNKTEEIQKWKKVFVENCKYKDIAENLFEAIGGNASYSFNSSHSLVYSLIGYWCAYYKVNHPEAFLVSQINHPKSSAKQNESEYIESFIKEAACMGTKLKLPVLRSNSPTTVLIEGEVFYGLTGIKGISETTAKILTKINAKDFDDYVDKALNIKKVSITNGKRISRQSITKAHIESLVKIGFFGDVYENLDKYHNWLIEQNRSEKTGYISEKVMAGLNIEREKDLAISPEDHANDSLGFCWFSKIARIYDGLHIKYQDKDSWMLIEVNEVRKGNKNGRDWKMIKGETLDGDITAFCDTCGVVSKGDVILASFKRGRSDAISISEIHLVS